jgi:hypothetical protein
MELIMAASNKAELGRSSLRTRELHTCVCHTPVSRDTGTASYAGFFFREYNFAFMSMGIYIFPLTTILRPRISVFCHGLLVLLLRIPIRSNIPTTLLPALRQLK